MTSFSSIETAINVFVVILSFIYWGVAFIILYHLTRFGVGVLPKRFSAIFLLGSVILFSASVFFYANLDINAFLQI